MTNEMLENFLSEMTDEELCGEVLSWEFNKKTTNDELERAIIDNHMSGFFANTLSEEQICFMRKTIKRYSKSPCLITADVESAPIFYPELQSYRPYMMTYGAANDEELVYEIGKYTARLSRAKGIHVTLAPVADININPNNPIVGCRAAGDSEERVSKIAGAYARGIQSENKLLATVKHFPGDGLDDRNQHFCTTVNPMSQEEWDESFGKAYKKMIDDGVAAFMVAHIALPCYDNTRDECGYLPATLSKKLMTGLLKEKLGFDGCIISDAMSMIGTAARVPLDRLSVEFLRAGGDLVLFPERDDFKRILAALKSGYLPRERLVDAARRVLRLKNRLGLFECDNYIASNEDMEKMKGLLTRAVEKSITILRNFDTVLPMKNLKAGSKALVITLTTGEVMCDKDSLSAFSDELERHGIEVIRMTNASHYKINDIIDDVDAAFVLINVNISSLSNSSGGSLRLGWNNMMTFWRGYLFKNKNLACISFGDPYKLYEMPYIRTYVNAYSNCESSQIAAARACLGEIGFEGSSPVRLEGFFERGE